MMSMEVDESTASCEDAGASVSCFDRLCMETLSNVLSFCDFQSAHCFARATSSSIRRALYDDAEQSRFLWKEVFRRHRFSSEPSQEIFTSTKPFSPMTYIRETRRRRQLSNNLLLPRTKKRSHTRSCCFNLPNRCFYFVPIIPEDHFHQWDDPPPVDFGCDSFILTSTSTGSELVTLDPFHGVLAVYESCLQNSVANDEAMLMDAMLKAANIIGGSKNLEWDEDMSEEQIAGEVFEQSVYRNHNIDQYKKPPFQVLFRMDDDIDPTNYFPTRNDVEGTVEIECGYHGIDSKIILEHGEVTGTMVAVGRMFTKEATAEGMEEESVCTELIAWSRRNQDPEARSQNRRNHLFGDRKICRFPWSFKSIDLCAIHCRVYATFAAADGPVVARNASDAGQVTGPSGNASTIVVYTMKPYPKQDSTCLRGNQEGNLYQEPDFYIKCQADVSSLAVDPSGNTLVVGTTNGTCEVFSILVDASGAPIGRRDSNIDIKSAFEEAIKHSESSNPSENGSGQASGLSRTRRALPAILDRPRISSFHYPSHLPLSTCGFVTLQHSSTDGSSLLLWQKDNDLTSSNGYRIVSLINLPLSSTTRAPRVVYDGRRILVYGSDHIGMIILVYHVLSSNEDIIHFQDSETKEETSGGVYNFTIPPRTRFANRIRHAALGGLQYYDSIHMTCNERYIVVNTKTGNCLSDSTCPYAEGLLVLDLQD